MTAYNPLEKRNLARSIEVELLAREKTPFSETRSIIGAGVYAIYYSGKFKPYFPLLNDDNQPPIYVGKAIPKGGRKGGATFEAATSRALAERLGQHAQSIQEATNLELVDFSVRYLVVDEIWIPLGENMLIDKFKPLWNHVIDGFGNKDPGLRRASQYSSPWDILHPGRKFAEKLAANPISRELILKRIDDHFAGRPLSNLPKGDLSNQELDD
jgi:ADP-ribose pyrophosphatase YjhB (NUDIX family)